MMFRLLTIVAFYLLTANTYAQDSLYTKIKEPDFPFEPMYLDSTFSLVSLPLEKYEIMIDRGMKKAGFSYSIKTPKSNLRLKASPSLTFVVKQGLINGTMTNVKDVYKLYNLTIDKKKETRSYLGTSITFSGSNGTSSTPDDIPIIYKKVRDDIYLLVINNLEKGEYVFETKVREIKLYSFGID